MKNVPEKIYLQIDADGETPEDFNELQVSWCADRINENDIAYIREPSSPDKIDEAISYFEEIKSERESKKEDDTVLINYVLIILKSIKQRSPTVKESEWYSKNEIFHFLIRKNYSKEIADELSQLWSDDLNGAFRKGQEKALRVKESETGEQEELIKLKEILKSESVFWALRNAVKSPSTLGDVEDDKYYDLYNIVCELRKPLDR